MCIGHEQRRRGDQLHTVYHALFEIRSYSTSRQYRVCQPELHEAFVPTQRSDLRQV